jgi:hypothetical protein
VASGGCLLAPSTCPPSVCVNITEIMQMTNSWVFCVCFRALQLLARTERKPHVAAEQRESAGVGACDRALRAESSDPERARTLLLLRRRHGARIRTDAGVAGADAVPLQLRLLRLGRHRQHVLAVLQKGAQEEAAAAAGRATRRVRLAAAAVAHLHPHVQFLEHGDGATHHPCHPQLPQ